MLERSKSIFKEAGVLHLPDNSSDHEPIFSIIEINSAEVEK